MASVGLAFPGNSATVWVVVSVFCDTAGTYSLACTLLNGTDANNLLYLPPPLYGSSKTTKGMPEKKTFAELLEGHTVSVVQ